MASKFIQGEEMVKTLLDSGLLFRINMEVLHPHGMALAVAFDDDNKFVDLKLLDAREHPEGMYFGAETMKEGLEKYNAFLNAGEAERLEKRREILGYVIQPDSTEKKSP